jgi:hypothetical protein
MEKASCRRAALAAVLMGLSLAGCAPSADTVLAELERQEPFYAALRTNEPETYAKVRQVITEAVAQGDRTAFRAKLRSIVLPAIMARVPASKPETLIAFATLGRDQARFLARERPDLCNEFLLGTYVEAGSILPRELTKRETILYSDLLNGPKTSAVSAMTPAELESVATPAILETASRLGVTPQQVGTALSQQGPEALQCQAGAELFDVILAMPPAKRDKLLRTLMADIQG